MGNEILVWFLIVLYALLGLMGVGLLLYVGYILWSFKKEVPYVPTPSKVIRKMVDAAALQPTDVVVDLGSGTGRIVHAVARVHAGDVTGVENSPLLLAISRMRTRFGRFRTHPAFLRQNFHALPLHNASVVMCFLTTEVMESLADKFAQELPAGARIVSYMFPLPDRVQGFSAERIPVGANGRDAIHVYTKHASSL